MIKLDTLQQHNLKGTCNIVRHQECQRERFFKMIVAILFGLKRQSVQVCTNLFMRKASGLKPFSDSNILLKNYLFLKDCVTSEGVVSHNVFNSSSLLVVK